jgi:sec-independent protein translocase protein TatB
MMMQAPIEVASLGMWDSLILMVMALVVFGPRRLPEIGRQIGKLMYEVRKASNDFKFQMEDELRRAEEADRKKKEDERQSALALAAPAAEISQVPDAGPGAPSVSDSAVSEAKAGAPSSEAVSGSVVAAPAVESPYTGEGVYPNVSPDEFQHPEPYPRIQPPSTGEQVAAEPPGRMSVPLEMPTEATSASPVSEARPGAPAPNVAESTPAAATNPEFSEYRIPGAATTEPLPSAVPDTTPSSEAHHG